MAHIGSRKTAKMILDYSNGMLPAEAQREADEILSVFSGGSFRTVYLHKPTNVVYKIASSTWDQDYGNRKEIANVRVLSRMKWENVRIPKASLFRINGEDVLAMEYVQGTLGRDADSYAFQEARDEIYRKARLADMHGENFFFEDDGTLVPVDLASTRHRNIHEVDRRVLTCGDGSLWGR